MDTPYTLLHDEIHGLRNRLTGVFDGDVESIHAARVGTRRIRELLPLVVERTPAAGGGDVEQQFRELHRRLGRVRDVDAHQQLIEYVQHRIGPAIPSFVSVAASQHERRARLARKLIKQIERVEVDQLFDALEHLAIRRRWWHSDLSGVKLQRALVQRARTARGAIERATGIYFPNRLHEARIAMKKLRYAMEIAQRMRLAQRDKPIKYLRKTQDILGELHDRDTLPNELARDGVVPKNELQIVERLLTAEIGELHRRYLARRSRLLELCALETRVRSHAGPARVVLAATAVAASSGLLLARRRAASVS
jgi:CHAD domain-containing protein